MICDLCQKEFDETSCKQPCLGCGTRLACSGIRCPYCAYQTVPEIGWIQRLFASKKKSLVENSWKNAKPLRTFSEKECGEIAAIDIRDKKRLQRLLAIGTLPGIRFKLLKKFPSYILEIGYSRFTVDQDIADAISARRISAENL